MTIERMTAEEAEALYAAALDAQNGRIHRPGVHLEILRRAVNKLGRAETIHIEPEPEDDDQDYDDDQDRDYDDGLTSLQRETNDRLDMGRNDAGEWLGFM